MSDIHVYLENGFDHDRVTVAAGGAERTEDDVSTRLQVGLAAVVDLPVPDAGPVVLRLEVPGRGLTAEVEVDPATTPHVRVDLVGGSVQVAPQAAPPMFA